MFELLPIGKLKFTTIDPIDYRSLSGIQYSLSVIIDLTKVSFEFNWMKILISGVSILYVIGNSTSMLLCLIIRVRFWSINIIKV